MSNESVPPGSVLCSGCSPTGSRLDGLLEEVKLQAIGIVENAIIIEERDRTGDVVVKSSGGAAGERKSVRIVTEPIDAG